MKIKKYLNPSSSLPNPNIFQRSDGSYFYSNDGKSEINVTPLNKLTDNPAEWTYTDETGRIYTPKRNIKNTHTLTESGPVADYHNYLNYLNLSFKDKRNRDKTMAKAYLENGNFYDASMAYMGIKTPKNPFEITGEPTILPGRATPLLIQLSAKLMETINNFWKNLGKLKIRLGGNGKYASGILTKPGTAPTTFNGLNINYITSPKGGNVTHKFYTDLGSEYILTKDGFARRVKSFHGNTEGADAGLHEWNKGATRFLDSDELGWSYHAWTDLNKPLGFSEKDGVISLITKDNGKWRYVMRSELRPSAVKNKTIKDGIILSTYTTEPKVGKWILEYGTNPSGEINWFHPGSQVAFIEGMKQGGKLKGKGKPFVKGVSILDSDPTAYKYVKKKYKMHLEGGTLNLASGLANTALGMYAAFLHDKAIKQFINANKAKAKAAESEARADAYNKALETVLILNQALKQEGINSSDISTKYLALKIADGGNYDYLRNLYDDLNTLLLLLSNSNMANSIALLGTQLFDFIKNSKKAPQNLGENNNIEQQKVSV